MIRENSRPANASELERIGYEPAAFRRKPHAGGLAPRLRRDRLLLIARSVARDPPAAATPAGPIPNSGVIPGWRPAAQPGSRRDARSRNHERRLPGHPTLQSADPVRMALRGILCASVALWFTVSGVVFVADRGFLAGRVFVPHFALSAGVRRAEVFLAYDNVESHSTRL